GGHARVGFEDNIYYKKGERAVSNAQMVVRIKEMVENFGKEVATPQDVRDRFNLN
ncbi:MAG: 3-keto-5-aminohexanoate cleavage protein, partial [Myxococcota bacterium]